MLPMSPGRSWKFLFPATFISLYLLAVYKYHLLSSQRPAVPASESTTFIRPTRTTSDPPSSTLGLVLSTSASSQTLLSSPTPAVPELVPDSSLISQPSTFEGHPLERIPEKIWYKLGPKGLPEQSGEWIDSCLQPNPTYRHEFLTDKTAELYVLDHFSHRPDIVNTYLSLTIPILKADILRYLILYREGGLWSDLDVSCSEAPINNWVPSEYKEKANLVVGLEFDWAWENDNFLHSQFASWMIMATANSEHMMMVINDTLEGINEKAKENNVAVSDLNTTMIGEIVDATGPKRMTRSIVKSLEHKLQDIVDDRNISGLVVPKLLGDVLILPGNAFAALQNGHPKNQGPVLVTHHYAGTWKNDHGGELA